MSYQTIGPSWRGRLGTALAQNLVKAGRDVTIWQFEAGLRRGLSMSGTLMTAIWMVFPLIQKLRATFRPRRTLRARSHSVCRPGAQPK